MTFKNKNMNKLFLPLIALLFVVACNTSGEESKETKTTASESEVFVAEDGSFSVFFPDTPEKEEESVDTEVGVITLVTYIFEESMDKAYMVAYSDYPDLLIMMANTKDLLQGGKQGALASLGIDNLLEENDIEKGGVEGLYFRGNDGSDYHVEYEIYLKGNRLYQIAIIETGGRANSDKDQLFFESFKFN
jgi:hypothetical protein